MLTPSDDASTATAMDLGIAALDVTPRTALVVGDGPLATAARRALGECGVRIDPPTSNGAVDLLVDVTGDPAQWEKQLVNLRDEGTILLLVPAGAEPVDFDFYPTIHRRSLRLLARRGGPSDH